VTSGVLHLVVPEGIDDPQRASGGNTYDRRLRTALRDDGWTVHLVEVDGGWPWSAALGSRGLDAALGALPDGAIVLVDGLLASHLPEVMMPASARLRVVLLVHLPIGVDDENARATERQVVAAAASVVTPSAWCREWLLREYDLAPGRVHVAHPGVDPAPVVPSEGRGGSLLTVGSLAPVKGQDLLLEALADVRDLRWTWTCVGSVTVDRDFTARLRMRSVELGVDDRVDLTGPLTGDALEQVYAAADLLVLPSRAETYGMVVTEALARGLPVVAHDVGGVREALGPEPGVPGVLVLPEGPAALASALGRWLTEPALREDLRARARRRRAQLTGWSVTAGLVADVVRRAAA
jgi:glycosyltransferase involved in cell wall biosynthesis